MATLAPPRPERDLAEKDFRFVETGIPAEWAESYHPGGLHPIHFGDVLKQRYRITRKLGNGSFGTVWLAMDLTNVKYVALKVQMARGSLESKEMRIQALLAAEASHNPNSQFVITLLDSFIIEGPNGSHLCLVLEPMGPSISSVLNAQPEVYDPRNPQPSRFIKHRSRNLLRQVLQGLQFLHNVGVVHGDLQSGNLLFAIQDLTSVQPEALLQTKENSQIEELHRIDGKVDLWAPRYLAVAMPLDEYVLQGDDEVVKIIDMGGAFEEGDPPQRVVTPAALRAPESILGGSVGKGIDVWSFGCLLFEILTGASIFQLPPFGGSDESTDDDHLIQLIDIIGPLPETLLSRWTRSEQYYGPDGERLDTRPWDFDTDDDSAGEGRDDPLEREDEAMDEGDDYGDYADDSSAGEREPGPPKPYDSLEVLFKVNKPPEVDEGEEETIVSLLRLIFQYDPEQRPSVDELLKHSWFQT